MAFEEVKVALRPNNPQSVAVKIGLSKMRGTRAKASITLSPLFVRGKSFSEGDSFVVQVGTGTDEGKLRLVKNNSSGTAKLTRRAAIKNSSYFQIKLGVIPQFPDVVWASENVVWRNVDGATIEIDLPKWRPRAAAPAAGSLAIASPTTGVAFTGAKRLPQTSMLPPPVRRGTSVTSSLMGDPSPQRAALAEAARANLPEDPDDD